jgi:hypothetical protein
MYHIYNGNQDSADLKKLRTFKTHNSGSASQGASSTVFKGFSMSKIAPLGPGEEEEGGTEGLS